MNACRLFRRFQPGLPPTSTPPPQRPRLVSEQVLYQHPPHTPIRIEPCLAAAAPRSTSRASATAPARATSPTNSNGTFPEPRPSRPPSSLSPSICIHLPPSQPLRAAPAPPLRRAATSLPRHPSRARTARLPPSLFPHDPPVKLSLTTSKLWSPRPLRHPGPALGIQQIVSQHQAAACGRR
jgi:hypothetical protein